MPSYLYPREFVSTLYFGQNSNATARAFCAVTHSIINIPRQNIVLLTNSIKAISVLQRKEALAALTQTCAFSLERRVMGYSYCSLLFGWCNVITAGRASRDVSCRAAWKDHTYAPSFNGQKRTSKCQCQKQIRSSLVPFQQKKIREICFNIRISN